MLHLVNLTNAGTWRAPVHELIPVGPASVRAKRPRGVADTEARLLVAGCSANAASDGEWVVLEVPPITDHEVVVLG